MSRPRKTIETPETAKRDFITEVRVCRARLEMTQKDLADEVGVVPSVMSGLMADPDKISVGRLRAIVRALDPDPEILLRVIGYAAKDISRLKERGA